MLYYLLYEQLYKYVSPLRVFRYTTFRTAFAGITALFLCIALGPWLISRLKRFQIGQFIREESPAPPPWEAFSSSFRLSYRPCYGPTYGIRTCGLRSWRWWATAGSASWTIT